jgi:hypothetical protein
MLARTAPFVGVSFLRGNPGVLGEELIMQSTVGPYVHSEIMLGDDQGEVRCYTACSMVQQGGCARKFESGFTPSRRLKGTPCWTMPHGWDSVCFPLNGGMADYRLIYAVVLQLVAMQLPYNYGDLWQCCAKFMLPFERDVDCNSLPDWRVRGVYCSQMCLLFLRRLDCRGMITLPSHTRMQMWGTNSRGCSPNRLARMLLPGPT